MPAAEFNEAEVFLWMRRALDDVRHRGDMSDHAEFVECGRVNLTRIAEDAACAFEVADPSDDPAQPSPLDDETHWIWDAALRAAEYFEGGPDDGSR